MLVEELKALKEFLLFGAIESLATSRPRVRASPWPYPAALWRLLLPYQDILLSILCLFY